MKYAITLAAFLAVSSVYAQDYSATSNNTAASQSQSAAGAISGASGNITSIGMGGTTLSTQSTTYADESPLSDMVPNVFAPSLTAGSNLCAMSLSAGGSASGWGITLGGTYESSECNVRDSLRVMGAMLRTDGNPQAASILKSISCQSVIYWDSLELAAIETGNADLACKNERPRRMGRFELRPVADLPRGYDAVVSDNQNIREQEEIAVQGGPHDDDFNQTYGALF